MYATKIYLYIFNNFSKYTKYSFTLFINMSILSKINIDCIRY